MIASHAVPESCYGDETENRTTSIFSGLNFPDVPTNAIIPLSSSLKINEKASSDYLEISGEDNDSQLMLGNTNKRKSDTPSLDMLKSLDENINITKNIQESKAISNNASLLSSLYFDEINTSISYPSLSTSLSPPASVSSSQCKYRRDIISRPSVSLSQSPSPTVSTSLSLAHTPNLSYHPSLEYITPHTHAASSTALPSQPSYSRVHAIDTTVDSPVDPTSTTSTTTDLAADLVRENERLRQQLDDLRRSMTISDTNTQTNSSTDTETETETRTETDTRPSARMDTSDLSLTTSLSVYGGGTNINSHPTSLSSTTPTPTPMLSNNKNDMSTEQRTHYHTLLHQEETLRVLLRQEQAEILTEIQEAQQEEQKRVQRSVAGVVKGLIGACWPPNQSANTPASRTNSSSTVDMISPNNMERQQNAPSSLGVAATETAAAAADETKNKKYVCCGTCEQWLMAPNEAEYVYCPGCGSVNDCVPNRSPVGAASTLCSQGNTNRINNTTTSSPPPPARRLAAKPWYLQCLPGQT